MEEPRVHMDRLDVLKLWVRHHYKRPANELQSIKEMEIMGVPFWETGTAGLERVEQPFFVPADDTADGQPAFLLIVPQKKREPGQLLRPDQLVMREGIRRELKLHQLWVRMMTWGYYDLRGRRIPRLNEEQILRLGRGQPLFPPKAKVAKKEDDGEKGNVVSEEGSEKNSKQTQADGEGGVENKTEVEGGEDGGNAERGSEEEYEDDDTGLES